jgi:hypothetical protein
VYGSVDTSVAWWIDGDTNSMVVGRRECVDFDWLFERSIVLIVAIVECVEGYIL